MSTTTGEVAWALRLDPVEASRLAKAMKGPRGSGWYHAWSDEEVRWAEAANALRMATGMGWPSACARTQIVAQFPEATHLLLVDGEPALATRDVGDLIGAYTAAGGTGTVVVLP